MVHKNYHAFQFSSAVAPLISEICSPLKDLRIPYFRYLKIFRDGTYLHLVNKEMLDYQKHYFTSANGQGAFFPTELNKAKSSAFFCIWPAETLSDPILNILYEHNIWNGCSFYIRNQYSSEIFSFAFGRNTDPAMNFFINNVDKLKKFSYYFVHKVSHITNIEKEKLAVYKEGVSTTYFCEEKQKEETDFYSKIYPKEILLPLKQEFVSLSRKEFLCLNLLAHGETAKTSAKIMGVSHRTIEAFVAALKQKTEINCKAELAKLFWYNDKLGKVF